MPSITSSSAPAPKLRVRYFVWTFLLLQRAHPLSTDVDSDDDKLAAAADLGDDFAGSAFERGALNDVLCFTGRTVSLAFDDLPREDDVLKVEDEEVVIFKFVRGMS
jgi:hypothetical protein